MKKTIATKWWSIAVILLVFSALSAGLVYAQAGNGALTVDACNDLDADGVCGPGDPLPSGVEACLNDGSMCQPVPAVFGSLGAGSYTPFLRFTGASQGYYPTTPRTPVDLADGESKTVTLGAVYPVHPKGIAVHAGLNKVYAAFQGPMGVTEVPTDTTVSANTSAKPYPFVAVIDGETDEVLQTIPGGPDGIGLEPWGVAVSGDYVYVGSFAEGRVSIIDATLDTVIANVAPDRADFQPISPYVNPVNGWVHFPDYQGGRVTMIEGTTIVADPLIADQFGFSPFEVVVANPMDGYNFVTMRDAIFENEFDPTPFKLKSFNSTDPSSLEAFEIIAPDASSKPRPSGSPHAIGLWQEDWMTEPRIFVTYADDSRTASDPPDFINPYKLLVYNFFTSDPKSLIQRNHGVEVGPYAEVGLVHNPAANHMLGTYAGYAYRDGMGDEAACDSPDRGGIYAVNFDGNLIDGEAPGAWKLPDRVVGNPALDSDALLWKNPFELAVNPNNDKVYVTDRCWNEYPEGGQPGGGAVLVFFDTPTDPVEPTPTPTVEPTETPTVEPTETPTTTPTVEPNGVSLIATGPASVAPGEVFSVTVQAQGVSGDGLYGFQFELNYDPALISADNLQVNPDFTFVLTEDVDNGAGKITVVASRQGNVPGLTGDVTLVTFDATAIGASGSATFSFENEKLGDPAAQPIPVTAQTYTVVIETQATPTPTTEPSATPTPTTEPTETPTTEPTETPTTEPTETPTTEPTETPTATPTSEPGIVVVVGQVILPGRSGNDWSGATVTVDGSSENAVTDNSGAFSIANVAAGTHSSITADADGYLPAICSSPTLTAPTTTLTAVSLLSGDVDGNNTIDVADASAVGMSFGLTGPDLPADINKDGVVDIFDVILASVNFGEGPQTWNCISSE